ncbi:MAG: helix-turn-helix domain-containing protein [Paludibacter sp.]|nr:helix-turn-helix domain-containing protein [Paludibacter sp.]
MYEKKIPKDLNCGIVVTMEVIGGKWKTCLINDINKGIRRPGELHRAHPEASLRVISQQLLELEKNNIIEKKIFPVLPPKVEYSLTETGKTLLPLIAQMLSWGNEYRSIINISD